MIRAAIVGFGNIGPVHAAAIAALPGVELAAICDTDPECLELARAAYPQEAHPGLVLYEDYHRMLGTAGIDTVHICTPHWLHAPMAEAALKAGRHVLMEKPMAMDSREGRRLAAVQRVSGKNLGLCFQNRYRPPLVEAKRLVDSGEFGRLLGVRIVVAWKRDAAYYASRGGWRGRWKTEGGGVLINQAVHSLDLIQWLGGGCLATRGIGGTMSLPRLIEVEDTAVVFMDLASGGRGILFATNGNVEDSPVEIEILCEKARMRISEALYLSPTGAGMSRAEGDSGTLRLAPDSEPGGGAADAKHAYWGNRHADLIAHFYGCVRDGLPFPLGAREGLKSLAMLDDYYAAIGRPARSGNGADAEATQGEHDA